MDEANSAVDLDAVQSKIRSLEAEMEPIASKIVDCLYVCVIDWLEDETTKAINAKPDRAHELGKDGLQPLRDGLNALKEEMKTVVEDEYLKDGVWTHRVGPEIDHVEYDPGLDLGAMPRIFDEGIKTILVRLDKLLYSFRLPRVPPPHRSPPQPGNKMRPESLPAMNQALIAALTDYKRLADARQRLVASIKSLQKAQSQAAAVALWKSVK
jgi:hypothetical protein